MQCPIFLIDPIDIIQDVSLPPDETNICSDCCNCSYLQFEGLLPYLKEIRDKLKWEPDKADEFEFRIREQVVQISRLFDLEAGVKAGHFSKAHFQTTKIYPTNGTKYIKIPEFVKDTLQVRTLDNHLINESAWGVQDGFLVLFPCTSHRHCICSWNCTQPKRRVPRPWPAGCYKITARWGKDCADAAVQMAIRDYLIESYRVQDPVVLASTGLPVSRTFKVPYSWSSYISNYRSKMYLYSQFSFA